MENRVTMELSHDDVKKIVELVDGAEHLDEFEIVYGGFRLHVRRGNAEDSIRRGSKPSTVAPLAESASANSVALQAERKTTAAEFVLSEGEIAVKAPMLGTFYRCRAPGDPPFVELGQRVRADDTVCLIEVMKLFSSIPAGIDGVVTRILPEDGALVEYGQALVVIASGQG